MKVKSMRGETVDFAKYMAQNEDAIAVGNANMNARGDIVGPGGKVQKKREEIAAEYHAANPNAVRKVSIKDLTKEVLSKDLPTPEQAVRDYVATRQSTKKPPANPVDVGGVEPDAAPEIKKSGRKIADSSD